MAAPNEQGPTPRVSVVVAVYNGEEYLRHALDSLLNQTLRDLELIVVDDASTDSTPDILREYAERDPRVRVVRNETNTGPAAANLGIAAAWADLIGRQDADDESEPDRFEKQVAFLDAHPDVAVVGSALCHIDESGRKVDVQETPTRDEDIRDRLREGCPFSHVSAVYRAEALAEVGGYREAFRAALDYDLLLRIAEGHKLAALPEPLYRYRLVPSSITSSRQRVQSECRDLARRFADERRRTGIDSYDEYVRRGLFPSIGTEEPRGFHYRRVARYWFEAGNDRAALGNLRRAFLCAPWTLPQCAFLLGCILLRKALKGLGLLGLFRRIVYRK